MLRERLRGRRAARLVSGNVWIGAGSISGEKSTFWVRRAIFISGGFQMNNNLNQNLRGGIVMTRALEVV